MRHQLLTRWSRLRNLHVDPVGILDVETGIVALQRIGAALREIAHPGVPGEARDPDSEMIDTRGRASIVERDQHSAVAEANDSARLLLADHGEAEHPLIK